MVAGKINLATTTTLMENQPNSLMMIPPSLPLKAASSQTALMNTTNCLEQNFMRKIMRKNISNIWKQSILRRYQKILIN